MAFWTYILQLLSGKGCYTGHTDDFKARLAKHNAGGSTYTRRGMPWKLVYSTSFETRQEAVAFEKRIKKIGARSFLRGLGIT